MRSFSKSVHLTRWLPTWKTKSSM